MRSPHRILEICGAIVTPQYIESMIWMATLNNNVQSMPERSILAAKLRVTVTAARGNCHWLIFGISRDLRN